VAVALYPAARELEEGWRCGGFCHPEVLDGSFSEAGLRQVEKRAVEVPTLFREFDDFWMPFLGGQGPAPSYLMALNEDRRAALRERFHTNLPIAADGSIFLNARAWVVRGKR